MNKKKIYFVQPNSILGNSVYFPYAVGVIASYAFSFDDINESYELGGIIYKEDPMEDALSALEKPSLVAFSNYFWNYKYNLSVAENLKRRNPDCLIVFGGHQVPDSTAWLEAYPFIDMLIFSEGEIPFTNILRALKKQSNFADIPNIAFRQNGNIIRTETVYEGVSDYPSPYTSGIFDKLLNVSDELEFNAQLETNRGCPYHCSFCDWCSYDIKMRLFDLEKVKSDLRWISSHHISYCMCVDSNFGLFERDEEIASLAVELKKENGFPDKFGACFAKDKTERIFKINKVLNDAGMSKGVSLAFQSMSEEVLANVSRSNMNKDKLQDQLALYHEAGIPTYTELILGLPGETLDSFQKGICELLELGQHDAINVFRCEVYPNSTLGNPEYMKRFGLKTAVNKLNINHCKLSEAVFSGGLEYIIETSTMTSDELVSADVFSACIQSIHCHGMIQCFAMYLRHAKNISYYSFYTSLIRFFIEKEGVVGDTLRQITRCIRSAADGATDLSYLNPLFGDITWPYDEAMLLNFIYNFDVFYNEIAEYLIFCGLERNMLEELMRFQKNMIVRPGENDATEQFSYDFCSYFKSILENHPIELEKKDCKIRFCSQSVSEVWEEYARRVIWYGRRNKKTIRSVELI